MLSTGSVLVAIITGSSQLPLMITWKAFFFGGNFFSHIAHTSGVVNNDGQRLIGHSLFG